MISGRAATDGLDVVEGELRELARAKSMVELRETALAGLTSLARLEPGDVDGLQRAIDEGIEAIASEPHREAARAIFGSSPHRFEGLGTRHYRAANAFGVGVDAFRKRRPAKPSRYDEVISELCRAIVATHGSLPESASSSVIPSAGGRRCRMLAAGAVVVLLLLGGAVTWFVLVAGAGGDDPKEAALETQGQALEGCDIPVGATMDPTEPDAKMVPTMAAAFDSAGGIERLGCPAHTASRWDQLWTQQLEGSATQPAGSVVFSPDGSALWVEQVILDAYMRVGGAEGGNAQQLAGLPTEFEVQDDGWAVLWLDGGGGVISERLGSAAHWVPVEAMQVWEANGGADGDLGLPVADVNYVGGRLHQDYEGGWLELTESGDVEAVVVAPDEAAGQLAGLGPVAGRIVEQYDHTSWWIDDDGSRHWIPDTDVWYCLGGDGNVAVTNIGGWVLAQLPLSPPADCDEGAVAALDVWAWCTDILGEDARGEVVEGTTSWQCVQPGAGAQAVPVDVDQACQDQYDDPSAQAYMAIEGDPYTLRCRLR